MLAAVLPSTDIDKYCNMMSEVKLRTDSIRHFMGNDHPTLTEAIVLETVSLQLRKMLELIALGSLVANKKEYEKRYSNFSKAWNAELLLKDLARINPDFFPIAVVENQTDDPAAKRHITLRTGDVLTKKKFVAICTA